MENADELTLVDGETEVEESAEVPRHTVTVRFVDELGRQVWETWRMSVRTDEEMRVIAPPGLMISRNLKPYLHVIRISKPSGPMEFTVVYKFPKPKRKYRRTKLPD